MNVFAVIGLSAGFAREDAPTPTASGVFSQKPLAHQVSVLSGPGHRIADVKLDQVPPGLIRSATALGVSLPVAPPTAPQSGQALFCVVGSVGGFAREDAREPNLVGVYSDPKLAERVCTLAGFGHVVVPTALDQVLPGLARQAESLGFELRTPPVYDALRVSPLVGAELDLSRPPASTRPVNLG